MGVSRRFFDSVSTARSTQRWAIARLRPTLSRITALRICAAAIPILIWGSFFAFFEWGDRVAWPPELWAGSILFASAGGLGLSLLLVWPRSRSARARADRGNAPVAPEEIGARSVEW